MRIRRIADDTPELSATDLRESFKSAEIRVLLC